MEGSVHTIKENKEALAVAFMEIGLEVNDNKTKYIVMSRDQNAALSHSIKTAKKRGVTRNTTICIIL
jgi:thermostable 8-oxoguanine DNA glycosylase